MNDFETTVKELLNDRVDERTGPRRPAPAFDPNRRSAGAPSRSRKSGPWIVPLIAAAAVVVVAAGTFEASRLLADKHEHPATNRSTPAPPAPASLPVLVHLAGASIRLPRGWVARPYRLYMPPPGTGQTYGPDLGWCLTPSSTPTAVGGCPVWFRSFRASPQLQLNVDKRGGTNGDPPQVCAPGEVTQSSEQAAQRAFGDREAEYRRWAFQCSSGKAVVEEQYVVATGPAYILYSTRADPVVHRVMTELAAASSLPPSTAVLRYSDFGYVRRIHAVANGVQVSLDRAVDGSKIVNTDPATYEYVVPSNLFGDAHLKVGALAYLATDGTRVTAIYAVTR